MRLQLRIVAFFSSNPDAVLTQVEMIHKFGLSGSNAKDLLSPCVHQGVLTIETINRGRHVYKAGPALLEEL